MLLTCQVGFETFLAKELASVGTVAVEQGPGWIRIDQKISVESLAFPHLTLLAPVEVDRAPEHVS